MTIIRSIGLAVCISLAGFLCSGCGCLFFSIGIPNQWRIQNDNIEVSGGRDFDGIVRYDHITIGTPEKPWANQWLFSIMLTNREVLHSTDFTQEKIKAICPSNHVFSKARHGWAAGSALYSTPDYSFLLSESGTLLRFGAGINYTGKSNATIGNSEETIFYRVSWTKRQLHKLFGTNFVVISARSML